MNEDIINVFGYKRVSTERQVKKGYSLAEQQEEIEKYCKMENYNLIETFKDGSDKIGLNQQSSYSKGGALI